MRALSIRATAVGAITVLGLVLAGCSTPAADDSLIPQTPVVPETPTSTPATSPEPTRDADLPEEGAQTLTAKQLPIIIPSSEIPRVAIAGSTPIDADTADSVMQWAASLAWLGINDGDLRDPMVRGEQTVQPLLGYLTDDAADRVIEQVRRWNENPNPLDPEVLATDIATPMFFLFSPDNAGMGTYDQDPIYSNVVVHDPVIERLDGTSTAARYRVSFAITAMTYLRPNQETCQDINPDQCDARFYLGMSYPHEWIVEEDPSPQGSYLLDSWTEVSPTYGNLTDVSE